MNFRLAGCVIKNSEGKILLLHRNTSKRRQWELPGGKVEDAEDPEDTARRELKEELDLDVKILKQIGEKEFQEDGFIMSYVWFEAIIEDGEPIIMENNFDEYKYISVDELRAMDNLSSNLENLIREISA